VSRNRAIRTEYVNFIAVMFIASANIRIS